MKFKIGNTIIAFVLCLYFLSPVITAEDAAMRETAMKSLNEWKKFFKEEEVKKLGFDNRADFRVAELGTPIKLYTVNPDAMLGHDEEKEFNEIVTETNYYVYPVRSQGINKALLWMYKKDNIWKTARIGSAKMARSLMEAEGAINQQRTERGLEGAGPPKLVRVYQLYLDFFFIKDAQKEFIIPLQTVPNLQVEGSKFYTPAQLLPQWKQQIKDKEKSGEIKKVIRFSE